MAAIESFLHLLKKSPDGAIFNPWWQVDVENDLGEQAPWIRREQLRAYLVERVGNAQLALVGEALGYRGGHFSGIPMTSERMLLAGHHLLSSVTPQRTSNPEENPRGFSEPTASIVWNAFLELGLLSERFVFWNAFPWHPFDSNRGLLTNRKPSADELRQGAPILERMLQMFRIETVVAMGAVAAAQLDRIGRAATRVRHPANGGAAFFRKQLRDALL